MQRVRILIADNHEIVRMGLQSALESRAGYGVCGDAASGPELIDAEKKLSPDLVITELTARGLDGLHAAREILHRTPDRKILALTRCDSEMLAREALQIGVRGLLLKSDALMEVLAAVPAILNGRLYFTRRISEMLLQGYLRRDESCAHSRYAGLLTPRENEILKAIASGMTNRAISKLLAISPSTIETHRGNIMRKLDLHSVPQLLLYALRNNLVPMDNIISGTLRDEDETGQLVVDSADETRCAVRELTMATAVT